jgi:hypothetical protein
VRGGLSRACASAGRFLRPRLLASLQAPSALPSQLHGCSG